MRQATGIPLTIAISAIVHVAILGAAEWLPDPPKLAPPTPVVIELVPPTPASEAAPAPAATDPIEVVFLDSPLDVRAPDAAAKGTDPVDSDTTTKSTGPVAISTVPATSDPWAGPDAPVSRNPYLDMRRAPRPGTFVRDRWDDLEHVPKGTTPQEDISTGQLAPDGGGTHKSDQGPFTAKIDKDGSVSLKDKRNFNIRLTLPTAKDIGDMFQAWYYDPNKPVGTLGPPNQPERQTNLTRADVSGAERLSGDDSPVYAHEKDPTPASGDGIPILAGGFDITDALMRSRGTDPYASKKLAFLDSTRDERVQIGMKYKSEQLARIAQIVKKNLTRVWAATTDPQQRKQALFEMWDECVETGSAEVVEAATTARKIIVGFMRANFPADGPHAFTAAEIAACNRAKQSKAVFAPYE